MPAVAELLAWYSDQILRSPAAVLLHEPYRLDYFANGFRPTPFLRDLLKKYEAYIQFDAQTRAGADALCAVLMDPLLGNRLDAAPGCRRDL